MDYFRADEEMVYLGFHLENKLWKNPKADHIFILPDVGQIITRNYYPIVTGISHLLDEKSDPIANKWKNEEFDELCNEIKRLNQPYTTDIIFHLLDWDGKGQDDLVKYILKTKQQTLFDKKIHTISTNVDGFGVCYISLESNNIIELRDEVLLLSKARKYRSKCTVWLGLGSLIGSQHKFDFLAYNFDDWEYDEDLELLASDLLDGENKQRKTILLNNKKIGRNDKCPCGSNLKFKYCCGKNKSTT